MKRFLDSVVEISWTRFLCSSRTHAHRSGDKSNSPKIRHNPLFVMIYRRRLRRGSVIDFEWNDPTVREPAHTHTLTHPTYVQTKTKCPFGCLYASGGGGVAVRCKTGEGRKKKIYIIILIGKTLTLDGTTTGFRIFFLYHSSPRPRQPSPLYSSPRETVLYDDDHHHHWRLRGGGGVNPIFPILSLHIMYRNKVITLLCSRCIQHTHRQKRKKLPIQFVNMCTNITRQNRSLHFSKRKRLHGNLPSDNTY